MSSIETTRKISSSSSSEYRCKVKELQKLSEEIIWNKYFEKFNFYFANPINEILENVRTAEVILFKDLNYYDEDKEFLNGYYSNGGSCSVLRSIIKQREHDNSASKPNLITHPQHKIIMKRELKLQELRYSNQAHQGNKNIKSGLELLKAKRKKLLSSDQGSECSYFESPKGEILHMANPINVIELIEKGESRKVSRSYESELYDIYNPRQSSIMSLQSKNCSKDVNQPETLEDKSLRLSEMLGQFSEDFDNMDFFDVNRSDLEIIPLLMQEKKGHETTPMMIHDEFCYENTKDTSNSLAIPIKTILPHGNDFNKHPAKIEDVKESDPALVINKFIETLKNEKNHGKKQSYFDDDQGEQVDNNDRPVYLSLRRNAFQSERKTGIQRLYSKEVSKNMPFGTSMTNNLFQSPTSSTNLLKRFPKSSSSKNVLPLKLNFPSHQINQYKISKSARGTLHPKTRNECEKEKCQLSDRPLFNDIRLVKKIYSGTPATRVKKIIPKKSDIQGPKQKEQRSNRFVAHSPPKDFHVGYDTEREDLKMKSRGGWMLQMNTENSNQLSPKTARITSANNRLNSLKVSDSMRSLQETTGRFDGSSLWNSSHLTGLVDMESDTPRNQLIRNKSRLNLIDKSDKFEITLTESTRDQSGLIQNKRSQCNYERGEKDTRLRNLAKRYQSTRPTQPLKPRIIQPESEGKSLHSRLYSPSRKGYFFTERNETCQNERKSFKVNSKCPQQMRNPDYFAKNECTWSETAQNFCQEKLSSQLAEYYFAKYGNS